MKQIRLGIIGMGGMGTVHARNLAEGKAPRLRLAAVCDRNPRKTRHLPRRPPVYRRPRRSSPPAKLTPSSSPRPTSTMSPSASPPSTPASTSSSRNPSPRTRPTPSASSPPTKTPAKSSPSCITSAPTRATAGSANSSAPANSAPSAASTGSSPTGFAPRPITAPAAGAPPGPAKAAASCSTNAPHQLDLWWWLFGQPAQVRAFCQLGRFHQIEVEDSVTAVLEYADGAQGVFITTTGEAPGTNRLEVAADRGKIVIEGLNLHWTRTESPVAAWCASHPKGFEAPPAASQNFTFANTGGQHVEILQNFADAILDAAPLIAPAAEGIYSLELANAMLFSTFQNATIPLPLDAAAYAAALQSKIASAKT